MNYDLQPREVDHYDYDESEINDGDVIAIFRLDGIDPLIMYGTGGTIGHCGMALRFDGELYIIEA